MPENAVPVFRCGRLGRNDTRGGLKGGAPTPRTGANKSTGAVPRTGAAPFSLTSPRGCGSRERDARANKTTRPAAGTSPGSPSWPRGRANKREQDDGRGGRNGDIFGPRAQRRSGPAHEQARTSPREQDGPEAAPRAGRDPSRARPDAPEEIPRGARRRSAPRKRIYSTTRPTGKPKRANMSGMCRYSHTAAPPRQ